MPRFALARSASVFLALTMVQIAVADDVAVGDAYVRSESNGARWIIGSQGIEQVFDCSHDKFLLKSYKNKLTQPTTEYVVANEACTPFGLEVASFAGRHRLEKIWTKSLEPQTSADPADDHVAIEVKRGQLLGFCVLGAGDAVVDCVDWTAKVAYADGQNFASTDNPQLDQGPVWHYYQVATGSGCLEELGESVDVNLGGVSTRIRVPSGYRAPPEMHGIGATCFVVKNAFTLVRAWKAPKDGRVTIHGKALLKGAGRTFVSIEKISEIPNAPRSFPADFSQWRLEGAEASPINAGGRPAVQLSMTLTRGLLRARLRIAAYPGTPVLRQWVTLQNLGAAAVALPSPAPLVLSIDGKDAAAYTNYWLVGGNSRPNQGVLHQASMSESYRHALLGEASDNLVPWTAWQRKDGPADGCFVALDYLGAWNIRLDCSEKGPSMVSMSLPTLADYSLAPGESLELPVTTTGVFHRSLDDMGAHLYDWQYEYMWDRTNDDYFALSKWEPAWIPPGRNLQEQFAARLANLDMQSDLMREMGFDMLWDDAGWSRYPTWPVPDGFDSVFTPSHEGPDFSHTNHYLNKMGMKWLLWFAGRPSSGLMDSKVGAWGNFQWRTDGVGRFDRTGDRALREDLERFLDHNPRSSFHTCSGGSRYAHLFEIIRLGDVHMLSDPGCGPESNCFFSYLEPPDKWCDVMESLSSLCQFKEDTFKQVLTMTPFWGPFGGLTVPPLAEREIRHTNQLYNYLKREGAAGHWSYAFHPKVTGDDPNYYFQRTSRDRTKACIILKHRSQAAVTVRPVELLPDHSYRVGFDLTAETTTRTGADLMDRGIEVKDQKPGELIYLGLANWPGSANDKTAPQAPGRVLARHETNIGHSGVGIYWSPGSDDGWIGYYEVRRDGATVGKTAKGNYFFDHSEGSTSKACYEVRTVDSNGNPSHWVTASPIGDEPWTAWALGGHFATAGRDGWKAETTDDTKTFAAMQWVPPAKNPAGDFGGTPNQPGGIEGYWEGKGTARVGRGWQQAASDTACVRTWTAPRSGRVLVAGRATKEYYHQALGTDLRARIMLNDRVAWPADGGWAAAPLNDLYGASHQLSLEVKAGDALRFVLDRSTDPANAIAAWMPKIVYNDATPAPASGGSVLRILCGATKPYTDRDGNVWSADQYFSGGAPMATSATIDGVTPTNDDQPLYQFGREGRDFSYSIPVEPGLYAIRLKFAEPKYRWSFERPFNVSINGCEAIRDMDVCHDARGPQKTHEKVLRLLVPDGDGKLVVRFTAGFSPMRKSEMAMVQAIEVLPETKRTVRVDCGSKNDFVDWNSSVWNADGPREGACIESKKAVLHASPTLYDQGLYQTAFAGKDIQYSLAVPPGLYAVHLKFAELWLGEAGKRPMNIEINGRRVRRSWDPATAAGQCGMAADVRIEDIAPNAAGQIVIRASAAGPNEAILQGIEIE